MLETLLKPNTGASLSGCVRWTQPMDGVRVCDFDCALTVPPALPAEPSEVPCEVLFCRQGGLRLTMTDGRQVFLQEHEGTAAARRKCEEPFGRGRIIWR